MPMIDVYAAAGTFSDPHALAQNLATELMTIEQVPDIPMFRKNTAAFVHELPSSSLSNVDGDSTYVRVQVLTNAGALDRDKQLAVVSRLTAARRRGGRRSVARRAHVGPPDRGARRRLGARRAREHERGTRRGRSRADRRTPGGQAGRLGRARAPADSRTNTGRARLTWRNGRSEGGRDGITL